MIAFFNHINDIRDELEYEIDGIVYKLNSYEQQKKIGFTSRFPKWALAHKFPAEEVATKIVDVKFQVGRTGSITPVAILALLHVKRLSRIKNECLRRRGIVRNGPAGRTGRMDRSSASTNPGGKRWMRFAYPPYENP